MIKRIILLISAAILSFLICSCGENVKTVSTVSNVQNNNTQSKITASNPVHYDGNVVTNAVYYFTTPDGKNIYLGAKVDDVINELGEYIDYYETKNDALDGLDKIYTYDGFKLYVTSLEDGDLISVIEITDKKCKTHEGITVGDEVNDVTLTYGNAAQNNAYIFDKGNTQLVIVFAESKVTSIQYKLIKE